LHELGKTGFFWSGFPMFVPSLSWRNHHFKKQMAQKARFRTWATSPRRVTCQDSAGTWCEGRGATGISSPTAAPMITCTHKNTPFFLSFRYVYPEPALANDDRFVIGFTASRTKKPALEKR
jgi:hypothetical protein